MTQEEYPLITFGRRLGGIAYDALLAGSFVLIISAITHVILTARGMGGVEPGSTLSRILFLYYIFLTFGFFHWFWTHDGATLGMRAWKIRVVTLENGRLNLMHSLARFGFAALLPVVSQLWSLVDKDKLALHDRLSGTKLIYLGE
jgi:uncharacterized RDD family membrane protein YckC